MDPNNTGSYSPNPAPNLNQPTNPVPPVTPPPGENIPSGSSQNNLKRILLGLAIVLLLVIVSVVIFFGKKSTGQSVQKSSYVFTINGQSVPEADFAAIYNFEKQHNAQGFNKETTLNSIKELYLRNYVLKQEYAKQSFSESSLSAQLNSYDYTGDLVSAPEELKTLTAQNDIMTKALSSALGVQVRSGNVLTLVVLQKVTDAQKQQLETLMSQRLTYYKNSLNAGTKIEQVKTLFQNDAQIKAQPLVHANVLAFTDMQKSHPILPGQDFVKYVFSTPSNKASSVFNISSGNVDMYAVVYPTSPLIQGKYTDIRSWLFDQEKALQVKTSFSDFN